MEMGHPKIVKHKNVKRSIFMSTRNVIFSTVAIILFLCSLQSSNKDYRQCLLFLLLHSNALICLTYFYYFYFYFVSMNLIIYSRFIIWVAFHPTQILYFLYYSSTSMFIIIQCDLEIRVELNVGGLVFECWKFELVGFCSRAKFSKCFILVHSILVHGIF